MIRRLAASAAASLVLVAAAAVAPAVAIDPDKGRPGYCKDEKGVTVVVDFGKLGGGVIVRCAPSGRGTGLDALKDAGFQIAGVQRWGESFICRIENRPSAEEKVPVAGNPDYRERCVDTPPASGYWSYWHAPNGGYWEYSQWGVKNRSVIPGGFEGWSFSLNASADANPQPRVAPTRPGQAPTAAPAQGTDHGPTSDDPDETQAPPAEGGDDAGSSADDSALPKPLPRDKRTVPTAGPSSDDPSDDVAFSDGSDRGDVEASLRDESGASVYAPWVAGGVVVLLGALGAWTARRRRTAQDRG